MSPALCYQVTFANIPRHTALDPASMDHTNAKPRHNAHIEFGVVTSTTNLSVFNKPWYLHHSQRNSDPSEKWLLKDISTTLTPKRVLNAKHRFVLTLRTRGGCLLMIVVFVTPSLLVAIIFTPTERGWCGRLLVSTLHCRDN